MGSLGCMGCSKGSHKAYTGASAHAWTLTPHTHQYLLYVSSCASFSAGSLEKFYLTAAPKRRLRGPVLVLCVTSFVLFASSSPSLTSPSSYWASFTAWPDMYASQTLIRTTWPLLVLHHYFSSFFFICYFQLACPLQTLPSPAYFLFGAPAFCATSWYFKKCSFLPV